MSVISEIVLTALPAKRKRNPKGWVNIHAPCCTHNGQARPDARFRGGFHFHQDGFVYQCFNCRFRASWFPGRKVNSAFRSLMRYLGMTSEQIGTVELEALRQIQEGDFEESRYDILESTKINKLPESAKPLHEYLDNPSPDFVKCLRYIEERNPALIDLVDFWYSDTPDFKDRLIIPFFYNGEIHGYTARLCDNKSKKVKYLSETDSGFLYNADVLNEPHRKIVFVQEGCLDARSTQGVAVLKAEGSEKQIRWLNEYDRIRKIVVPDRDEAGYGLVQTALEQGYSVSMPDFMQTMKIKDTEQAVGRYGQLFVMNELLRSEIQDPLTIEVKFKQWVK